MPKRMMSPEEAELNQLNIKYCARMVKAILDAGKQNVECGQDLLKKMNKELETLIEHQTEHEKCTSEFLGEIKKMAEHSVANLTSKVLLNSFDKNLASRRINEYKEELESLVASSDAAENNYFVVQENISLLKNKVVDLGVTVQQEEEFIHAQEEAAAEAERKRQEEEAKRQEEEEAERQRQEEEEAERQRKEEEEAERQRQEEEEAELQRQEEEEAERQRQEEEAKYERQRKVKAERDRKRRAEEQDLERQRKAENDRKRRAEERDMERKRKAEEKAENDRKRRAEAHRDRQRKSKAVTPSMEDLMLMPTDSPTQKKTPTPTPSINGATTPKKYSTPISNKAATPLNKVATPAANKTTPTTTTFKSTPTKTTPLGNKIAIVPPTPVYSHPKKPAKPPMRKITATPAPKKFKPNTDANKTMETELEDNSFWDDDD